MSAKYLEKTVNNNETVILEGRVHWIYLVPRLLLAILVLLIGLAAQGSGVWSGLSGAGYYSRSLSADSMIYTILVVAVIDIAILWKPIAMILSTKLCFTDKRMISQKGLFRVSSLDAPLDKITSVSVRKGFWGSILGYGHIRIRTSTGSFSFAGIADVDEFKKHLMWQIDQYGREMKREQASELAFLLNRSVNARGGSDPRMGGNVQPMANVQAGSASQPMANAQPDFGQQPMANGQPGFVPQPNAASMPASGQEAEGK